MNLLFYRHTDECCFQFNLQKNIGKEWNDWSWYGNSRYKLCMLPITLEYQVATRLELRIMWRSSVNICENISSWWLQTTGDWNGCITYIPQTNHRLDSPSSYWHTTWKFSTGSELFDTYRMSRVNGATGKSILITIILNMMKFPLTSIPNSITTQSDSLSVNWRRKSLTTVCTPKYRSGLFWKISWHRS